MAKLVVNMNVEMADDILKKLAESMGAAIAEGKAPQKLVMEIKDIGGKMIIRLEPTEEALLAGKGVGAQASR